MRPKTAVNKLLVTLNILWHDNHIVDVPEEAESQIAEARKYKSDNLNEQHSLCRMNIVLRPSFPSNLQPKRARGQKTLNFIDRQRQRFLRAAVAQRA